MKTSIQLFCERAKITEAEYHDNLTVEGWLDLEGCTAITSLPDNLTVGGWLDLRGTAITSLPDNLTVGGGVMLADGSHKHIGTKTPAISQIELSWRNQYIRLAKLRGEEIPPHAKIQYL